MSLHPDIAALLDLIQLGTESGARSPVPQLTPAQARADFDAALLDRWLTAVERHTPGDVDGALLEAAGWSNAEIDRL
ncbi:MAG: hypothetical protein ACK5AT_19395, partial [Bradyrhizobium sp.]